MPAEHRAPWAPQPPTHGRPPGSAGPPPRATVTRGGLWIYSDLCYLLVLIIILNYIQGLALYIYRYGNFHD